MFLNLFTSVIKNKHTVISRTLLNFTLLVINIASSYCFSFSFFFNFKFSNK